MVFKHNFLFIYAPHYETGGDLFPVMYGYMLTARDCDNFSIYHTDLVKGLVELGVDDKPKTKGEGYRLLNDSARYLGELMAADHKGEEGYNLTALNGQDFLWISLVKYN